MDKEMIHYCVEGYNKEGHLWQSSFDAPEGTDWEELDRLALNSLPYEYTYDYNYGRRK